MTAYLEYTDSLNYSSLEKGQLPFYCLSNLLKEDIPLHHHDFLELSLVMNGRGTETLNGITHELKPGSISFLLPHHIHEIHTNPEAPLHLFCCMFDISLIFESTTDAQLGRILLQVGNQLPSYNDLNENDAREMNLICSAIASEYSSSKIGKYSVIRSKVIEALALYARSHSTAILSHSHIQNAKIKKLDWDIIQFVHTNYLNELTQDGLCKKFDASPAYISRLFQRTLNTHFLDYIHKLRVRRASSLLLTTEMSILDISVDSGFESFRTFSRVFKEHTGMSPRAFRKMSSEPGS
ncbi:AraC family transcriptional regulator [Paenibacillus nasutitermitis]|uniref:HTH-type transcriptional activator RhaS n=1 Tax=Paenibacillus nasutitermitis TaxID=1652958 RepID=A0A916Z205_9BACL|nr:AraC family transcriptional regulator [Paenibacillus nasutitermitis]GGD72980.1 HTH-type transcriptional activator RhaS [Paenibacillus nasutitermitis]